ncbi:MAG: trigger factor [Armatimonadota bacterium]
MQVAVERRPGSQVALTVTVEPEQVQERIEQLFQKYARRVTVPGFRPGKAPRSLVEGRVDMAALAQDAMEDLIETSYRDALKQEDLQPLEQGKIEDQSIGDDKSLTYTVLVTVRPEIKLPDLKEIQVRHIATEVTDEHVNMQIDRLRESGADFAEMTDTPIETGDFVTIDYTMQVDGEPYPEGDTSGYPLQVGSDTFFPELNDALLGLKAGDTTTVTTTYAEDYSNTELAGKTATFQVAVQSLRRQVLPELDEAWVSAISGGSLQAVDELREAVKKRLVQDAERMDRDHVRSELLSQLVEKTEMEVPTAMAEEEYEHLMEDLEHRLSHERMSMEDYARQQGKTVADIENEEQVMARDMVRRSLILQEIARQGQISVTDQELDTMILVESFSRGTAQSIEKAQRDLPKMRKEMEKSGQLDRLANRLFQEKILAYLEENADVEVEGWPKPGEEPAEEPTLDEAVPAEEPLAETPAPGSEPVAEEPAEEERESSPAGEEEPPAS